MTKYIEHTGKYQESYDSMVEIAREFICDEMTDLQMLFNNVYGIYDTYYTDFGKFFEVIDDLDNDCYVVLHDVWKHIFDKTISQMPAHKDLIYTIWLYISCEEQSVDVEYMLEELMDKTIEFIKNYNNN